MNYWLAGTDLFNEKKWMWWPTRNSITKEHSDWSPGQPDNWGNKQDCLALWHKQNYAWDDQRCSGSWNGYVCEFYQV